MLTTSIILPDPTGGGRGSCFHSADLSIVECRPECPEGYVFIVDDDLLAYPDLGKWLWRMTAYLNTSINLHQNVRMAKS